MVFIGIDPGGSGGVAAIGDDGRLLLVEKMPTTEMALLSLLVSLTVGKDARAMLERVHAGPKMASRAAFTFGMGVGFIRMALVAAVIPFESPTPQAWQKAIGGLETDPNWKTSGGGFQGRDKNVSKRRAQEMFAGVTVTHAIADAMLIAEYCRRVHLGTAAAPPPPKPKRKKKRGERAMSGKGDAF